jgi:hypothetical protein
MHAWMTKGRVGRASWGNDPLFTTLRTTSLSTSPITRWSLSKWFALREFRKKRLQISMSFRCWHYLSCTWTCLKKLKRCTRLLSNAQPFFSPIGNSSLDISMPATVTGRRSMLPSQNQRPLWRRSSLLSSPEWKNRKRLDLSLDALRCVRNATSRIGFARWWRSRPSAKMRSPASEMIRVPSWMIRGRWRLVSWCRCLTLPG